MLKAKVQNKQGKAVEIELRSNEYEVFRGLHELGVCGSLNRLPLTDRADAAVRITLSSDSDFGNALLKLLSEKDTLGDAYLLDTAVSNTREEILEALEQDVLSEQFADKDELFAAIRNMKIQNAPHKLSFYCPLEGNLDDKESEEYLRTSNRELLGVQDKIEERLKLEQADVDMAEYVGEHAGLSDKLWLAEWHVENRERTLYGRIDCYLTEPPTESETETLRKVIRGQNSDGFGEGFEQRPIETDDGDLYVSFWNCGKDYFLRTETEMAEFEQISNIKMGGI